MELAEIIAHGKDIQNEINGHREDCLPAGEASWMRILEEHVICYRFELLDAAERTLEAEASEAGWKKQVDEAIAEMNEMREATDATNSAYASECARADKAETERDDKDLLLWAYGGEWVHREPYPVKAESWYWESPAYVKDRGQGPLRAVNGIAQMTDEFREAILEAQVRAKNDSA